MEALIQSVPERCTRLLPIIEYLAQMAHHETNQGQVSCIASSQDEGLNQDVVNRACDSWKSVEFILRTTRTLAVSVFGASEDVASLNWHELPIVPSVTELLGRNQVEGELGYFNLRFCIVWNFDVRCVYTNCSY